MKENKIAGYEFKESRYYKCIDGTVYRNVAAGLIKENWHINRKVGNYKIHAEYFGDCALPQTDYYIVDVKNSVVYESKGHTYSCLNELVEALKSL